MTFNGKEIKVLNFWTIFWAAAAANVATLVAWLILVVVLGIAASGSGGY